MRATRGPPIDGDGDPRRACNFDPVGLCARGRADRRANRGVQPERPSTSSTSRRIWVRCPPRTATSRPPISGCSWGRAPDSTTHHRNSTPVVARHRWCRSEGRTRRTDRGCEGPGRGDGHGYPSGSRRADQAREQSHPRTLSAPSKMHRDARWITRVLGVVGRVHAFVGSVVLGHPPDADPDAGRLVPGRLSPSRSPNRCALAEARLATDRRFRVWFSVAAATFCAATNERCGRCRSGRAFWRGSRKRRHRGSQLCMPFGVAARPQRPRG